MLGAELREVAAPAEHTLRVPPSALSGPARARLPRSSAPRTWAPPTAPGSGTPAARAPPTCSGAAPGDVSAAPDAVVRPADHAQVSAVLEVCAAHAVAVVPFGGGTSVVGGVEPLRRGFDAVIALDLRRGPAGRRRPGGPNRHAGGGAAHPAGGGTARRPTG